MSNDKFLEFPATLHYSSGFPLVIGLHHIDNYDEIIISNENDNLPGTTRSGSTVDGYEIVKGFHHYFITTRPRCLFDKSSFYWCNKKKRGYGYLEFEVGYRNYLKVPFEILLDGTSPYLFPSRPGLNAPSDILNVVVGETTSNYPNKLIIQTKNNTHSYHLEPDLLHFIRIDDKNFPDILDFKVEYIGISTGRSGNRSFTDRLWNHEKVREISGIIQKNSPNLQIYVFAYQAKYAIEPVPDRFILNSHIIESKIGYRGWAEILEAGLIRYFQPQYNKEFREFLISEMPSWLKELNNILSPDFLPKQKTFLSIVFASDTRSRGEKSWIFGKFFSDHTSPTASGLITYELP